jgi:ribosomal protein S12 methylthiotransferase
MKTVGLISLGCPKNQLDSEIMIGLLQQAGYALVPEDEAEILIVNTCGFIQSAKEEAVEATLEAAQYKARGTCRKVIMAGCFAQRYASELTVEMPEVDLFMGLDDVPRIVELCRQLDADDDSRVSPRLSARQPSAYLYDHRLPRANLGKAHTAYVKIAEGCRYRCAFCAIPSIRGALRSRSQDSIVREVRHLVEQGVKEVLLIAQDTTSYGVDLAGRSQIVPLLEALVSVPEIQWIRLMYAYPTSLDLPLMRLIATEPKICTYLDLPLQHIDQAILNAMRRAITEAQTRALLDRLRAEIPGLTLRTSLIVGFPGETEAAFRKLEDFIREAQFERLGVFAYSREEGTAAYDLPDQVPADMAQRRHDRLMEIQAGIALAKHQRLVGGVQTVLIDGESSETELLLEGRLEGQAPDIDGVVYITEGTTAPGRFEPVEITEAHPYDLVGRLVTGITPERRMR